MGPTLRRFASLLVIAALLLEGCGGGKRSSASLPAVVTLPTAKSVSPASIPAPPMASTAVLPASAMTAGRRPSIDIKALGWTQIPGGAVYVAASSDGSIWVLSSVGSGLDRAIWHYANGTWTNIPGAAMRLSVAPNGTLWAVNSAGGIYSYNGSAWSTIAGGASDISVGADGSVYVISNQGGSAYGRGIWHYANGVWSQLPGAALRVAASWDTGTYAGGIAAGGFYVTTGVNAIYYYNPGTGFTQIPGGASQVAPTKSGGLFALGYVPNGDGSSPIYYNNLNASSWTQQPGAAVSIATNGSTVYAIGAAGGIYMSPVAGSGTGGGSLAITALDDSAPTALTMLHVSTSGLNPSAAVTATFKNGTALAAIVTPASVGQDGTLGVPVPLYIDPSTGQTASASLSMTLTQGAQTSPPVTVNVQDIPQLSAYGTSAGTISRAFFNYQILALGQHVGELQALQLSRNNTVNTSQAQNNAFALLTSTIKARNDVDRLMTGSTTAIPVGTTSKGTNVNYNMTSLTVEDRVLGWYLVNLASAIGSTTGALSLPTRKELSRRNRTHTLSLNFGAISKTLGLTTILGTINATIDTNKAAHKGDVIGVMTSVGGGIAGLVTVAAFIAGAPAIAGTATIVGLGFATVSVWNHVYNEYTSLTALERASEQGGSPDAVLNAYKDMIDQRNAAVLDGVGALITGLGTAGGGAEAKEVFGILLNETGTNVVEGAGLVKEAYSLTSSLMEDQDRKVETDGATEINNAFNSSSPDFFQEVTGATNISNSNGVSLLTGPIGMEIDQSGLIDTSGVSDSTGTYDLMLPVASPFIDYPNLFGVAYDPITNTGLGSVNLGLSGLAVGGSTTPITLPSITGSCNDTDAGAPDADDPDCD